MKYIEDIDLGDEFGPVKIEVKPDDVIDFCKTWIREEENSKNKEVRRIINKFQRRIIKNKGIKIHSLMEF